MRNTTKLVLERLEDRLVPAIAVMTDLAGNVTLTNVGDLTSPILFQQTANRTWTVTEGDVTDVAGLVAGNLTINFSHSRTDDVLFVDLGGFTTGGSLAVQEGTGNTFFLFLGGGLVSGNLALANLATIDTSVGGVRMTGNYTVQDAAVTIPVAVTLGDNGIGGNLSVTAGDAGVDVNSITGDRIEGSVSVTLGNGPNFFSLVSTDSVNSPDSVGGGIIYTGGNGGNSVTVDAAVVGSVSVTMGATTGIDQNAFLQDQGSTIGGNLFVTAGANTGTATTSVTVGGTVGHNLTILTGVGSPDSPTLVDLQGTIQGTAYFDLGAGTRTLDFEVTAAILGSSINYYGTGAGTNTVLFDGTTHAISAHFNLGTGTPTAGDTFELGDRQNLAILYVNFKMNDVSGVTDTFLNNGGTHQPHLVIVY